MGFLLNIWQIIDGFKTIGGLILAGTGVIVRVAGAEETGRDMTDLGLVLTTGGAIHGGVKKLKTR